MWKGAALCTLCSALALTATGCDALTGGTLCTDSIEPGIVFSAFDAETGASLTAQALARAIEGTYIDTLQVSSISGEGEVLSRSGADERAGTYTVLAEVDGYVPWVKTGVRVRDAECHVRQVVLEARMRRPDA